MKRSVRLWVLVIGLAAAGGLGSALAEDLKGKFFIAGGKDDYLELAISGNSVTGRLVSFLSMPVTNPGPGPKTRMVPGPAAPITEGKVLISTKDTLQIQFKISDVGYVGWFALDRGSVAGTKTYDAKTVVGWYAVKE